MFPKLYGFDVLKRKHLRYFYGSEESTTVATAVGFGWVELCAIHQDMTF